MTLLNRFEHGGTQCRSQRQSKECGEADRCRHGQGKLFVNVTGCTAKHRQRHKYRHQHGSNTDHRTGNLTHRFFGCSLRRQTFARHNTLNVFNDHNRVIDHNTDHQYHRKHGQYVNRHTHVGNKGKTTQQGNRYNNGRNQRIADVLQEEIHHQEYQYDGFQKRIGHFLNRNIHEFGSIVRNFPAHAVWKILLQNCHFFFHGSRRCQSVTAVGQHHCHTGGIHAVQTYGSRIVLHTQADFGNVFQIDIRTIGIGYQNDVAKLFSSAQLTLRCNGRRNGLTCSRRQRTDGAC